MKRLLLVICLSWCAIPVFAQLGKMQFEDAEEQFAAGKFKEAIALLEESEKTLGKSNPMIEHLRIMSRVELLKLDPEANIGQLEIAQKEAKDFLAKYDGDTRIEDKYRDIYKAGKTLSAMPSKAEIEKRRSDELAKAEAERKADEKSLLPGYRDGLTAEALISRIPGFLKQTRMDTLEVLYFADYSRMVFISANTRQSIGFSVIESYNDKSDRECAKAKASYEQKRRT